MNKENLCKGVPKELQSKIMALTPEQQTMFDKVNKRLKGLDILHIQAFISACQEQCSPPELFRILTSGTKASTHCSNGVEGHVKKGHSPCHRRHNRRRY